MIELQRISQDLMTLKETVERLQMEWERTNPNGHVVGILAKANRLGKFERWLPQLENSIALLEDMQSRVHWFT